jgi:hypothetical protein
MVATSRFARLTGGKFPIMMFIYQQETETEFSVSHLLLLLHNFLPLSICKHYDFSKILSLRKT